MAGKNQGEGNRDAARAYNESTREFVDSGKVESSAQDAKRARQGAERGDLDRAEEIGKGHAKAEDPQVKR
jgi:hypothetical protein